MRNLGRFTKTAAFALVLSALSAAPALAGFCDVLPFFCDDDSGRRSSPASVDVQPQPSGTPAVTPEIDPNMISGTIAILTGGVLILAGKRRRC